MTVLKKSFYIHWSAGRSPRVHEVNLGGDPSRILPFSRLRDQACRLSMVSPPLTEVRDPAITILCSPELGPIGQTESDGTGRSESNEDDSAPSALQVVLPSDRTEEQPCRSEYMRSGLPKPHQPNQVITHNYLPPHGPEPPRVEV